MDNATGTSAKPAYSHTVSLRVNHRPQPIAVAHALAEAVVTSTIGVPAEVRLKFRDQEHRLAEAMNMNFATPLIVGVRTEHDKSPVQVFDGEITGFGTEYDTQNGTFTIVYGHDRSHRLRRGYPDKIYTEMTLGEIARDILGRHSLTLEKSLDRTIAAVRYRHKPQERLSDWDLLNTLARRYGAHIVTNGKVVTLARPSIDRAGAFEITHGSNLKALRAAASVDGQVDSVEARTWHSDSKKPQPFVVATGNSTQEFKIDSAGMAAGPHAASRLFEAAKHTGARLAATSYALQEDTKILAQTMARAVTNAFADFEATIEFAPTLHAGSAVRLRNVGPPFAGTYIATTVRHEVYENEFSTVVSFAGSAHGLVENNLRQVAGVEIGIVDKVKDDPHQHGAVKLKFPWLSDKYVSDWARTVQFGGTGGGGILSPSVGDEVLVAFEQGRLDRPYVIGGLYNGIDKPTHHSTPLVDSGGHVNRKSLSNRKGDRLELLETSDEGSGDQGIRLTTCDQKFRIELDRRNGRIIIDADGPVEITARNNDLRLHADKEIFIEGKNGINLTSEKGPVAVKSNTEFSVTSEKVEVNTSGKAGITLNSNNGPVTVKPTTEFSVTSEKVDINASGKGGVKFTASAGTFDVTADSVALHGNNDSKITAQTVEVGADGTNTVTIHGNNVNISKKVDIGGS
ncbi:VgrG-related protein [Nocardia brasiliensis]|uniref:VgrG-related protein n=1 Tax=Nocardia brasiliensis TaxID=37326 RepID=UPI00245750DD|nr:VgrG-related protein [Nocardia brasiliensis]